MISIGSIQDCCLCGACADACPKSAITFSDEKHTFFYPVVDNQRCISCDFCEKVCPELNLIERQPAITAFAAFSNDDKVKKNSTSGGIFFELAKTILQHGGVVFGAVFDSDFHVKHIAADTIEDVKRMCGSKYVQSNMSGCYKQIEDHLNKGQSVLFSGCPCQCAGITRFFRNKNKDNLYIVDFVCHGIESDSMFQSYLSYLEKRYQSKVIDFEFRNKEKFGWEKSEVKISFADGSVIARPYYEDPYVKGMLQGISCKEACYRCAFKDFHSGSDITLGDYWGVKENDPTVYDSMGSSIVSVQTTKALSLLKSVEGISLFERSIEQLTIKNKGLFTPFDRGMNYEQFWKEVQSSPDPFLLLNKIVKPTAKETMMGMAKRTYKRLREAICHE